MAKEQCKYRGVIKDEGDDTVCEHTNACYIQQNCKQSKGGRKK